MAFLKSLLLYYNIILFLTASRGNEVKSNKINISRSPLLNNKIEENNYTFTNINNISGQNSVEAGNPVPVTISTRPETPAWSRRSWFAHLEYFQTSTSTRNSPTYNSSNTDGTMTSLSQQDLENIAEYSDSEVKLPVLPCETSNDCQKWDTGAPMRCEEGQCQCPDTLCWHYQLQSQGGGYVNVFSCQECGPLGSACNSNDECEKPGTCLTDGFCHCDEGVNYYDICLVQVVRFEDNDLTIVLGCIFLAIVFAFCFIAYQPNIYAFWWRTCHRISTDEEDQQNAATRRRTRRLRRHKSPAFTHTEIFRGSENQPSV